jgi:protease YdgD
LAPTRTLAGLLFVALAALIAPAPEAQADDKPGEWPSRMDQAHVAEILGDMGFDTDRRSDGNLIVTWTAQPTKVRGAIEVKSRSATHQTPSLTAFALIPAAALRYLSRHDLSDFSERWNKRQPIGRELILANSGVLAYQDILVPKPSVEAEQSFRDEIRDFQTVLGDLIAALDRESKLHAGDGEKAYSEDWELSDPSTLPGRAIGLLETREGYLCTASLVAEDVILTAAHCVLDEGDIHRRPERFSAGYDHGDTVATAGILSLFVSPDYDPDRNVNPSSDDTRPDLDWALLRLDQPIGRKTGFLQVRRVDKTGLELLGSSWTVIQIGYGGGVRRPKLRRNCLPGEVESEYQYSTQCGLEKGDSGSPVLLLEGDQYRIIGVNYAWANSELVNHASFAVGSAAFDKPLRDFLGGALAGVSVKDWMRNPKDESEPNMGQRSNLH